MRGKVRAERLVDVLPAAAPPGGSASGGTRPARRCANRSSGDPQELRRAVDDHHPDLAVEDTQSEPVEQDPRAARVVHEHSPSLQVAQRAARPWGRGSGTSRGSRPCRSGARTRRSAPRPIARRACARSRPARRRRSPARPTGRRRDGVSAACASMSSGDGALRRAGPSRRVSRCRTRRRQVVRGGDPPPRVLVAVAGVDQRPR